MRCDTEEKKSKAGGGNPRSPRSSLELLEKEEVPEERETLCSSDLFSASLGLP